MFKGITSNGAETFEGTIDEFRISKGIARWTRNFTSMFKTKDQLIEEAKQKGYKKPIWAVGDWTIDFWVQARQRYLTLEKLIYVPEYGEMYDKVPVIQLPDTNNWHHVAVVCAQEKVKVFIDGKRKLYTRKDRFDQALENL